MNTKLNSKRIDSKKAKNIFGKGPGSLQHTSFTLLGSTYHIQDVYVDSNGNGKCEDGEKVVSMTGAFE